jgi:hypothetical protein
MPASAPTVNPMGGNPLFKFDPGNHRICLLCKKGPVRIAVSTFKGTRGYYHAKCVREAKAAERAAAKKRTPKFGTKAWANFPFHEQADFPDPESNNFSMELVRYVLRRKMTKDEGSALNERYRRRFHEPA